MRLDVLGACGTYSGPGGACSGYLLRRDGFSLWVDAGNGTFGRLQEHVPAEQVGAVYLSHRHHDHAADLYCFFYALWFHPSRPRGIPVFAPPGVLETLEHLVGPDSRPAFRAVLDWREFRPGDETEIGPFRLRGYEGRHSAPNVSVRVEAGGQSVCYSGDTGPNDELVRAAAGADLFLCEASYQDAYPGSPDIHMKAREAGRIAREAGAARLALTHIWPLRDPEVSRAEAAEEFDGPVDLATALGGWDV